MAVLGVVALALLVLLIARPSTISGSTKDGLVRQQAAVAKARAAEAEAAARKAAAEPLAGLRPQAVASVRTPQV